MKYLYEVLAIGFIHEIKLIKVTTQTAAKVYKKKKFEVNFCGAY